MEDVNTNDVIILPKLTELPFQTLGFINSPRFINSFKDHAKLEDLAMEVNSKCTHLQTHLNNLNTTLSSLLVSSISNSIQAKSSIDDFILNLEKLSIISSYYGNRVERRKVEKMVDKDLAYIARELRRLDNIRQYAEVVIKLEALVGDLEDAALSALNRHTGHIFSISHPSRSIPGDFNGNLNTVRGAVKAINNIEDVLMGVMKAHPQWSNLLKTVDARVDKILLRLRPQVIADHRSLLASLGWPPKLVNISIQNGDATGIPNPLVLMEGVKRESYSQSFLALCALQHVHFRREDRHRLVLGQKKQSNFGLWAIDELVSPIASKVEHHMLKWTDQPELMFALVYKVTRDFIEGLDDVLQPLIDTARLLNCSAKEAWVSSMMQVLSNFLAKHVFPVYAVRYRDKSTRSDSISSWLHLIDLIVKFDKQMQSFLSSEMYLFMAGTSRELVRSMSALSLFSDRPDWLHIWVKVDLKDAWNKLKAELKDEKVAWSCSRKLGSQENSLSTGDDHKAPHVAEFVLNTTWDLIQRCQTLPGTARRIQFIKYAPVKFLWQFLKVLHSRHSSSEFPAYDSEEALIRVCQLVNAARFSEFKLQEWSDDIGLLELTLAANGHDSNSIGDPNSSFLHEEVDSLIEMQSNWVMEIITHILRHFEDTSSCYFHDMHQFELTLSASHEGNIVISSDLVVALDNLRGKLLLVKEHLNNNDFLDTWRSVAQGLDHYIFRSIMSFDIGFSEEGAKRFTADMEGLFFVFKAFCARPDAFFPCIRDFLKLIRLDKEELVGLLSNLSDNTKSSDCLLSHSISSLSVDQAVKILNNRSFLV